MVDVETTEAIFRRVYVGAWRRNLPSLEISTHELVTLLPSLLRGGGLGLLWPRIPHRVEEYGAVGEMLERSYRHYTNAQNRMVSETALLSSMMAEAGIESILVKGWALGSMYAPPQIRRSGDVDLIVPSGALFEAKQIVSTARRSGLTTSVDLVGDEEWRAKRTSPSDDFRLHLQYLSCGNVQVPVLGSSDALRHVCLHLIGHFKGILSITSPVWLCDIGALLEDSSSDFDWDRVLGSSEPERKFVSVAIVLARDLVGVDSERLPPLLRDLELPNWASQSMLERWSEPIWSFHHEVEARGKIGAIKRIWPSPLNAALATNGPLDREFYLPWQALAMARKMVIHAGRLTRKSVRFKE